MSAPKKFINDPNQVVDEALWGLMETCPHLKRIEGMNCVIDGDFKKDKVALISGSGSGHEPGHTGVVGAGMIHAAPMGNVFAAPAVSTILAAIRAVTGPKGALVVVNNYTGDRLNFGMAVEQCKTEGLNLRLVIVAEDCALPDQGVVGRRGLASCAFVMKIAGAVADAGGDLDAVYNAAMDVCGRIGTLGCALTSANVPGAPRNTRLDGADIMEMGLGIHGEPGFRATNMRDANAITHEMMSAIMSPSELPEGVPTGSPMNSSLLPTGASVVLMVNGMGGTPPIELTVLASTATNWLRERKYNIERVMVGNFVTSLEAAGASFSILALPSGDAGARMLALFDAPTAAWGWPKCVARPAARADRMIPVPAAASAEGDAKDNNASGRAIESTRGQMHAALRALLATLTEKEAQLSAWDAQVGDGDCGQQWRSGITGLVDGANAGKVDDVLSVRSLQQCADMLADSMGGTSGAICQIFFRAAAAGLRADPSPGNAFAAGLKAICTYGRAREGMRTMVDALAPASTILASGGSMSEAAAAAAKGAEATKAMSAGAGRSSYVREEMLRQVPDPGAWAVAWVLQTLASL